MKITNNSSTPAPPSGSSGSARAGTTARQAPVQGSGTGGAPSTDATARLSQLEAQFSQSDFNSAKVNEISSAIAGGRYQVNAGAIADGLLASTAAIAGKSGASA